MSERAVTASDSTLKAGPASIGKEAVIIAIAVTAVVLAATRATFLVTGVCVGMAITALLRFRMIRRRFGRTAAKQEGQRR
jgi:hypothetical protein